MIFLFFYKNAFRSGFEILHSFLHYAKIVIYLKQSINFSNIFQNNE